ncbi:sulfite oxidase heme-binding subunit YedZ [Roseomonas sp. BN140053]|uniref:sulfite oxidase heme-binding subunit YedZ n=1 Tax=Roseomonas sp. BN140053 TaxID=3391898 RepID=UPI0039E7B59C
MSEAALPHARRPRDPARAARPKPLPWPWRDRGGRFSWFKALPFAATLLPGAVTAGQWALDELGAEPFTAAIHDTGLWAIRFLAISLAVSPLKRLGEWPRVLQLRRMLGLAALGYAVAHLFLYVLDQDFRLLHVAAELLRRNYLTIGLMGLIGMGVLGWTSTDGSIRRLGREWKRVHAIVYAVVPLAVVHFFLQSKVDVSEAVLMGGFFLWLVLWRLLPITWQARIPALLGLAVVSALGTAAMEYAWYALATRVPAERLLWANLDVSFGLRPAVWVGVLGLAVAVAVAGWRGLRHLRRGGGGVREH